MVPVCFFFVAFNSKIRVTMIVYGFVASLMSCILGNYYSTSKKWQEKGTGSTFVCKLLH